MAGEHDGNKIKGGQAERCEAKRAGPGPGRRKTGSTECCTRSRVVSTSLLLLSSPAESRAISTLALVTFCGFPSGGKSTRAQELSAYLSAKLASSSSPALSRLKVIIINDESLGLPKSSYDDSRAEKPARATLFSAVLRVLGKDCIVIVDAMNYIKGSRYQMYCAAREMSCRTCTVFIATPPEQCRTWNAARPPTSAYLDATLDNLMTRFEEPSSAARWDSPLVTVPYFDPPLYAASSGEQGMIGSAAAERVWEAITTGDIKPPNVATLPIPTYTTSYLTLLESTTTTLLVTLLATQSLSPLSGPTSLLLPTTPPVRVTLTLNKTVSMPMCQRLKRQFTKLNMHTGNEMDVGKIAELFAEYLESAIR